MRILVTGGAGFIGSFLVDRLVEAGHEVRIFDNLDPQVHPQGKIPLFLNKAAEFVKGDVRDYEAFRMALQGVDVIFHEAAVVGLAQSLYEIKRYVDVNIGGTANLLNILANEKHAVRKIVIPGSMSSYGEGLYECQKCGKVRPAPRSAEQLEARQWDIQCPQCRGDLVALPITEEEALNGTFFYSLTKKSQEELGLIFGRTYNIPVTVLRYFSAYGPRQALSNPYTGVVAIFLNRLKNNNPPVIYEDGRQTRDYVSVHDIVSANLAVLNDSRSDYKVYNVGSGKPVMIAEIAGKLARLTGSHKEAHIAGQFRKGDIRNCYADVSLIKQDLQWEPKVSFDEGLIELVKWSENEQATDTFDAAELELKQRGLS